MYCFENALIKTNGFSYITTIAIVSNYESFINGPFHGTYIFMCIHNELIIKTIEQMQLMKLIKGLNVSNFYIDIYICKFSFYVMREILHTGVCYN